MIREEQQYADRLKRAECDLLRDVIEAKANGCEWARLALNKYDNTRGKV